jgi:hypothetical protein
MFYHEQGFDEFWQPGGTTVAGTKGVQMSPKGKLVERFLRLTTAHPDRGHPYTPVAFLVDYAHGWEPAPYRLNSFMNWHEQPDRFRYAEHERMLEEWFWTAYFPIGPQSEKPVTGTSEVFLPAVYGDIFDVIFAYPDVDKWTTIDTYPVVMVVGDIELTRAEGKRLSRYVENGGTLVLADGQVRGPGLGELKLPRLGPIAEADTYRWHLLTDERDPERPELSSRDLTHPAPRFRFRSIPKSVGRTLASATDRETFCTAIDRGKGRMVFLSIPRGLSITLHAHPVVARLMAHLTRGLMPIEVSGDVQWMVNETERGWAVTLLNPAGQSKPQHGITPTDFSENRKVVLRSRVPFRTARDRLIPTEPLEVLDNKVHCLVPAGGVRIIDLH